MGKLLAIIVALIICGILWAFPLYAVVNFTCFIFNVSFHLSLLQSFAVCLLASVLKSLLFNKEDE